MLLFHAPVFDIVFTSAAFALIDGNYREAVIGCTSAIEKFFEFFVHIVVRRAGVSAETYGALRGHVRRAERQCGAFHLCHLLELGRAFDPKAVDKLQSMRNKTAHEGYIPTRDEAIDSAELVWREIRWMLRDLYAKKDDLDLLIGEFANERRAICARSEPNVSSFLTNSLLGVCQGAAALAEVPFDRDLSWWKVVRRGGVIAGEPR